MDDAQRMKSGDEISSPVVVAATKPAASLVLPPLSPPSPASPALAKEPESKRKYTSFKEIFKHTGTDKMWRHAYDRYYDMWLTPYIKKEGLRILEIGANTGLSLGAWGMFFEHIPEVHGLSYGFGTNFNYTAVTCSLAPESCSKIKIFYGDQVRMCLYMPTCAHVSKCGECVHALCSSLEALLQT